MITCAAFFLVAVSLISMVGEYLLTQKVREEQRMAQALSVRAETPLSLLSADALYELAQSGSVQYGGRVIIADEYGACVADSLSEYNGRRLPLTEVAAVLNGTEFAHGFYGRRGSNWFTQTTNFAGDGAMFALYASRVGSLERPLGVLLFASPSQEVYDNLSHIQSQMILYLALVACAVLILSFFMSRSFTQPIDNLSQGIDRMTKGDLSARVAVSGKNEFAQLAEAFNMMCERLESLDQTRNQFVSNASHELKTPLSTMKILLETLLYQSEYDPEMAKEFMSDINKEIDRLNSIVNDLLTLVHFDSGKVELKQTKLSLDELLRTTIRRLTPLAQDREIDVSFTAADPIETTGDQMKLEQVFYNLIDNAIKYTVGGGKVKVELTRTGRIAVITVTDTGIGIPKADLRHVFDRFYRVDKARARETGGTGLGLSIVRQIVMLHEGKISVVSEEEKGTTFTVELPIVNLS